MAAEYTGFIYVLSYRADTFEYHQMNIYTSRPGGYQPDRQYTDGHERGPADGRLLAQRLFALLRSHTAPEPEQCDAAAGDRALGQPVDTVQRGADVQLAAAPPSA